MKCVERFDTEDEEWIVLATFDLVDGRVFADWRDPAYQHEIAVSGIFAEASGEVRPVDGHRFYYALDSAYAGSSLRRVVARETAAAR